MFTDFYRNLGRRLPDCLRFFTGIWREGIRFVSGFLPVVGEEAPEEAAVFTNFSGFWEGGVRIAYGFAPDFGKEASRLFTDF